MPTGTAYTLNEALMYMLQKAARSDRVPNINRNDQIVNYNIADTPAKEKLARALGADIFDLQNMGYSTTRGGDQFLTGDLRVRRILTVAEYENFLERLLGPETVEYIITAGDGPMFGLNPVGAHVNLDNVALRENLRELANLESLEGRLIVPKNPHLLLLGVPSGSRRVLDLGLDYAQAEQLPPFSHYTAPQTDTLENFGFSREQIGQIVQEGVLGASHVTRAGRELGVANLLPHRTALDGLGRTLYAVPILPRR